MNKDISVIVPVYNLEPFLERSIQSLINQTIFNQLEIILIDDGSSDNSFNICEEYSHKYSNIIAVHQVNKGVSAARNHGLRIASGTYLAFMDADDYVEKDMYEILLHNIQRYNADMSIVDFFICFDDGIKIKKRGSFTTKQWTKEEAISDFLAGKYVGINIFDKLIVRDKVKELYFKEGKAIGEDMFYIFEVLLNIDLIYGDFVGKYYYQKRDGSAMKSAFSEKYFDTIYFSEKMVKIIEQKMPQIKEQAVAHLIHEECKTVERMYLNGFDQKYQKQKKEILTKIRRYSIFKAFQYLNRRQAFGLILMKVSPLLYIKILKLLKIE